MKKIITLCSLVFCVFLFHCKKDTFQSKHLNTSAEENRLLTVAQAQDWFTQKYGETKSVSLPNGQRSLVDITPIWAFAKEESSRGVPVVIVPIVPREELESGNRLKAFLSFYFSGEGLIDVKLIFSIADVSYADGSKEKTPETYSGIMLKYNLDGEMLKYSPLLKDGKLIGFLDSISIQPNGGNLAKVTIIDSTQVVWVNNFFGDPVFMQALPEIQPFLDFLLPINGEWQPTGGDGGGGSNTSGGVPGTYGGSGSDAGVNTGGFIPQEGTLLGLGIIPPNDPYFIHHAVLNFNTNPFQTINQYLANHGYQFQMTFDDAQMSFIANNPELINPFYVFLTFHNNQISKDFAQMVVDFISEQDVLSENQYYSQLMQLLVTPVSNSIMPYLQSHTSIPAGIQNALNLYMQALVTDEEFRISLANHGNPVFLSTNWAKSFILTPEQGTSTETNDEEDALILAHPGAALIIAANRFVARSKQKSFYGTNQDITWLGKGDAFLHTFFQAANTQTIGADLTLAFANAHEVDAPPLLHLETSMDLFNNNVGIALGIANPTKTYNQIAELVRDKIWLGECVYLDPVSHTESLEYEDFYDPITAPQNLNGILPTTTMKWTNQ